MRFPILTAALALSVTTAMLSHSSHAQPLERDASAEEIARLNKADELNKQGAEAAKKEEWQTALKLLREAWQLKKAYDIAGSLAGAERQLGMWAEAATHMRYARTHMPTDSSAASRKKADKLMKVMQGHVITLNLSCKVPGATVTSNGRELGITPLSEPIFVTPGATVVIAREGYRPETVVVGSIAGSTQSIALDLKKPEPPKPPPPPPETPSGPGPDARLVAGIAVGVGALAGFGVGIAGTMMADKDADEVAALQTGNAQSCFSQNAGRCNELVSAAEAHDDNQSLAAGGYVAGTVLAGLSAGLLVWWATDDTEEADEGKEAPAKDAFLVVPMVDEHGAGLMMMGAW